MNQYGLTDVHAIASIDALISDYINAEKLMAHFDKWGISADELTESRIDMFLNIIQFAKLQRLYLGDIPQPYTDYLRHIREYGSVVFSFLDILWKIHIEWKSDTQVDVFSPLGLKVMKISVGSYILLYDELGNGVLSIHF